MAINFRGVLRARQHLPDPWNDVPQRPNETIEVDVRRDSPGGNGGVFETCSAPGSANNSRVGKFCKAPFFLTRNGIRRISVGNLLLRQRDQLLGDQDSTLDVLERYGCPSIKIPPCFAKRTRKQKS